MDGFVVRVARARHAARQPQP